MHHAWAEEPPTLPVECSAAPGAPGAPAVARAALVEARGELGPLAAREAARAGPAAEEGGGTLGALSGKQRCSGCRCTSSRHGTAQLGGTSTRMWPVGTVGHAQTHSCTYGRRGRSRGGLRKSNHVHRCSRRTGCCKTGPQASAVETAAAGEREATAAGMAAMAAGVAAAAGMEEAAATDSSTQAIVTGMWRLTPTRCR